MKKFLIYAEQRFTFISLMIYSGTPLDPFLTDGFTIEEGDRSIFRLLYTLTYIVSLLLIALRWKKVAYVFNKDKLIWPLIGVCALSSFWSSDPDVTVRRFIGLAGTTIFGIYLASRYTLKQQLKLCAYMFGISGIMCFLFVIFVPHFGFDLVEAHSWRGIFPTKNVLGKRFVLSAAIFLFLAMTTQENRWVSWLGYATSAVMIFFSKSTTCLGNFIMLTAAFLIYYRILNLKYKVMIPILTFFSAIGMVLYILFISYADTIFGLVGKDATLTGRSELWPVVLEMIGKKPWLGYGYGAFWLKTSSSEYSIVLQAVEWDVPNAHNGFLDLWLGLGLLGVLVFLIGFVINLLRAIYLIRLNQNQKENVWLLLYITFIILSNLTETTLLVENSIEWVLYVSAVLSSRYMLHSYKFSCPTT
jgi:O-antigen ligase